MRDKSVIAAVCVFLLSLSVSLISMTAGAEPDISVFCSTDKPYYTYGGSGKLYVTVRNEGPGPIAVRNISVTFPWFGWYQGGWDGNLTVADIGNNTVDEKSVSETFEVEFTVPAEGRPWTWNNALVEVAYAWGEESDYAREYMPISIETPVTQSPNLTPMLYLMGANTILIVLAIIALFYVWASQRRLTQVPPAAFSTI
ncbi:hypothetical protein GWO13_06895 [Candidatus Bathyarchaeota archaeon]|nr:hypothetical protein [Candidatus Bathyarchaeota archaeon]